MDVKQVTLTRDSILTADDRKTVTVNVPEWGGEVTVKELCGRDRDNYEASLTQQRSDGSVVPNLGNMRAKLVVRAIVDDDGKRVFTDQDAGALGEKSAAAINRVFEAIADLSGMTDTSAEEIRGNSDAAESGASTSDLVESSV